MTNGTFDTDTDRIKTQASINISGGTANWDGTDTNGQGVYQDIITEVGEAYSAEYEVVMVDNKISHIYFGLIMKLVTLLGFIKSNL